MDTVVELILDQPVTHIQETTAIRSIFAGGAYGGILSGHTGLTLRSAAVGGDTRNAGLQVSLSEDGQRWTRVWQAAGVDAVWEFPITQTMAGAGVPGRPARYLKLEKTSRTPTPLLLRCIEVYGKE